MSEEAFKEYHGVKSRLLCSLQPQGLEMFWGLKWGARQAGLRGTMPPPEGHFDYCRYIQLTGSLETMWRQGGVCV